MGDSGLQPVTKDYVESQFTVKDLLNEEVYDRDQKKIGKVVDVILNNQGSTLAMSFTQNSHGMSGANSSDSSSRDLSSTSGRSGAASATNPTGSNMHGNDLSSSSGMSGSRNGSDRTSVVIAHGGLLKMGQDLMRVPLSRLNYDAGTKHLTLDVNSSEITNLTTADAGSQR